MAAWPDSEPRLIRYAKVFQRPLLPCLPASFSSRLAALLAFFWGLFFCLFFPRSGCSVLHSGGLLSCWAVARGWGTRDHDGAGAGGHRGPVLIQHRPFELQVNVVPAVPGSSPRTH